MVRLRTLLFLASVLILIALPAAAADNGFYLGGAVGSSDVTTGDLSSFKASGNATAYKIFAGARFIHFIGLEGQWSDLGSIKGDNTAGAEVKIKGYGLSVVGYIPIVFFDIYGKAGMFNSTIDTTNPGTVPPTNSRSSNDPVYGLGVQFRLQSFAIRGEAELFDVKNADKVYMYSIGASYTF